MLDNYLIWINRHTLNKVHRVSMTLNTQSSLNYNIVDLWEIRF